MSLYSSDPLINVYLTEVLDSESEQGKGDMPQKETDTISALGVHSQQRVKKAVYEINNRAKQNSISIERAYFDFMKTATYGGLERNAIKQKLGIGVGGTSVKEEKITEVTGFGGKVDPKTGKYDTSVTSASQKKYREGLPTRSKSLGRGSSQGLTNVPANNTYNGGVGDPNLAMTPARRAEIRAKKLGGKAGNKINSTMTRTEHREYILGLAVNKESFGWRNQLNELVGNSKKKTEKEELIKEMPAGESNKIIINPKLNEDIYSDYNLDAVVEYFYNEGLNENGVDILIEDLGVDEFCEFVDEIINEQLLFEWRRGPDGSRVRGDQTSKSGKHISTLKGGAKSASVRATPEHKARKAANEAEPSSTSGMKDSLKRQSEIATAKKAQKPTNSTPTQTKDKSKGGIFGALRDRAARDTELLKKSWNTAREVGKKHEKTAARVAGTVAGVASGAAKAAHTAGQKFGNSEAGQKTKKVLAKTTKAAAGAAGAGLGAKKSGKSAAGAAGRAVGTFVRKMREDSELVYEGNKAFPYEKVGNKLRSLSAKYKNTDDTDEKNKLSKRKEKIGKGYWYPEETEILDELKMPKNKNDKLPGLDFVTKINSGLRNLADKQIKSREKNVPYAALSASNEIQGDLIEQGMDQRQRESQLNQIKRQHLARKKQDEQKQSQDDRRYFQKLKSLGGDIEDVNENYDLASLSEDIRARNRARLNNSYVSDVEMTEETPDLKQQAMDIVMKRAGGAGNFAKKDPRKKVANTAYYDKTHNGPGSKPNIGESTKSIDSYNSSIGRRNVNKETPNDSKPGRVGVRLPNSPNKIDYAKGYRVTTTTPKMNVTYIKSDEKK